MMIFQSVSRTCINLLDPNTSRKFLQTPLQDTVTVLPSPTFILLTNFLTVVKEKLLETILCRNICENLCKSNVNSKENPRNFSTFELKNFF